MYDILAVPKDGLSGCYFAAGSNALLEIATVYCNTAIVLSVFTSLYYGSMMTKRTASRYYMFFIGGFIALMCVFGVSVFLSEVNIKMLGWCSMDSIGLVAKHIWFYLCVFLQATMIVGIVGVLWMSSKRSGRSNSLNRGTYLRFIGIILSQVIGFVPLYLAELLALSRQPIPDYLIYWYTIGFPLGHVIDTVVISAKCLEVFMAKRGRTFGKSKKQSRSGDRHQDSASGSDTNSDTNSSTNSSMNSTNASRADNASKTDGSSYKVGPTEDKAAGKKEADTSDSAEYERKKLARLKGPWICRWWMSRSLSVHIAVALGVPVIMFVGLVAVVSITLQDVRTENQKIATDVKFAGLLNNFIHNAQVERGLTGVFYSNPGNATLTKLDGQRAKTDPTRVALMEFVKTYENPRVMSTLDAFGAFSSIYSLLEHRKEINKAGCPNATDPECLTLVQATSYYTKINKMLLKLVVDIAKANTDPEIMEPLITSYFALVMTKELAGNERGVGAGAFTANSWDPAQLVKFLRLTQAQDTVDQSFLDWSTDEIGTIFKDTVKGDVVDTALAMRMKGLSNNNTQLATVTSVEWFGNTTGKIDLMRLVELNLGDQMTARASKRANESGAIVVNLLFAIVIVIWVNVLLAFNTRERIWKLPRKSEVSSNLIVACLMNCFRLKPSNRISMLLQIMLITVASCVVSLVILIIILRNNVVIAQTNHYVVDQMGIVRLINNFMHQSQRERGRTGVYIGSNRAQDKWIILYGQRLATDEQKFLLEPEFYKVAEVLGKDHKYYTESLQAFASMDTARAEIRTTMALGDALGWYTVMNRRLIKIMAELCVRGRSPANYLDMYAFVHFSQMKEQEGIQRLWGSVSVAAGAFTEANFNAFIRRDEAQVWLLDFFSKFGSTDAKAMYDDRSKGYEVAHEALRGKLMTKGADLSNVTVSEWFDGETRKMVIMRGMESWLSSNLAEKAQAEVDSSTDILITLVAISCVLIILKIYFVYQEVAAIIKRQQEQVKRATLKEMQRQAEDANKAAKKITDAKDDAQKLAQLQKQLETARDTLAIINGGIPNNDEVALSVVTWGRGDMKNATSLVKTMSVPAVAAHPVGAEILKGMLAGDNLMAALDFYLSVVHIYKKCTNEIVRKRLAASIESKFKKLGIVSADLIAGVSISDADIKSAPATLWDSAVISLLPALEDRLMPLLQTDENKAKLVACIASKETANRKPILDHSLQTILNVDGKPIGETTPLV